ILSQASAGRRNEVELSLDGTAGSATWLSERRDELWLGVRDRSPQVVRRSSVRSSAARELAHRPPSADEGRRNLLASFYASLDGTPSPVPLPTFDDGLRHVRFAEAVIDPDPQNTAAARADIDELLELAGELGTGIVVVPIWGRTRNLPGIATGRTPADDEALFLEGLRPLAVRAERTGARIFIEPLNRYQNDVCVTIADATRFRDAIDSPALLGVGDTFHMNIEEAAMAASLAAAGERPGHVQIG